MDRKELTTELSKWCREFSEVAGESGPPKLSGFLASRRIEAGLGKEDWDVVNATMDGVTRRVRIVSTRKSGSDFWLNWEDPENPEMGHGICSVRNIEDNERLARILDKVAP